MEKLPLCFLPECEGSYLLCEPHELHDLDGIQRSDEPVSKSTVNFWLFVPIAIWPVQRRSFCWSVSGTPARFTCEGSRAMGLMDAPLLKACSPTFCLRLIRF